MAGRKRLGCCSLCETDLLQGAEFGAHAMRATIVLVDGKTCMATICESCLPHLPGRLPEFWRNAMAAFAWERDLRGSDPSRPHLTAEQSLAEHENLLTLLGNVPLGVVAVQRWSEMNG